MLTVATDSPAYPPYFEHNNPKNGEGLESAVAYAVAKKLGYAQDKVKWVVEPFDSSYAPGPKSFDFDINEISITPARAKVVTFSTPYYTNPQGILVKAGSALAHATSLAAFKHAKIGVQIGTTSLAAVTAGIKPSQQPDVFNTSNDVVERVQDRPRERDRRRPGDRLRAHLRAEGLDDRRPVQRRRRRPAGACSWPRAHPIASCVDRAVGALRANGTLAALSKRWIASAAKVPVLH